MTSACSHQLLIKVSAFLLAGLLFIALFSGPGIALQNQAALRDEAQCLETDDILSYKIETDDIIRFTMKNGEKVIMRLKSYCPQLRYHDYLSYTPMNGKLCAGADEIKTRSGLPCLIGSIAPDKTQARNHRSNR